MEFNRNEGKSQILTFLPLAAIISLLKLNNPNIMKKDIHPQYFDQALVTCACGNTFTVGSTLKDINVEICSACHPFYTGKQKLLDTAHRVDKFKKRLAAKETSVGKGRGKKEKKAKQKTIKAAKKAKIETEKQ